MLIIMQILGRIKNIRTKVGMLTGIFCFNYGLARFVLENFREPDGQLGFIVFQTTMGQLLSIPLIIIGALFYI